MTTRWPMPPRCALRSVLRPARRSRASRPKCSAATLGACGASDGRRPWRSARNTTRRLRRTFARRIEDGARQVRVQALLDAFFKDGGEGEPRGGEDGAVATKDLRSDGSQRSRMICVASKTACSPCASAGARR